MQAAAVGQAGVDEGLRTVEAATGARQHPLDDLLDLGPVEDETVVSSCSPPRATKTRPGSLIQISSTSGSSSSGVSAPKPPMRWCSSSTVVVGERWEATVEVPVAVVGDDLVDEREAAWSSSSGSSRRTSSSRTSAST